MPRSLHLLRRRSLLVSAAALASSTGRWAWSQEGSSRPVRIVVPFGPGGAPDVVARLLATRLASRTGRPHIVENKAGANGVIGTNAVARAPGDGSTLLLHGPSLAINPSMYKKLPFDTEHDLTPITNVCATDGMLVVVNAKNAARTLREFVDGAKRSSTPMAYASPGVGNAFHLAAERLVGAAGFSATHIPYKGAGEAVTSLLSQDTQFMVASAPAVAPLIKSGQLRALAITSATAGSDFPGVPTIAQAGWPGLEMSLWYGLLGPRGIPGDQATQLAELVGRELKDPEFRDALLRLSLIPVGSSPGEFSRQLAREIVLYRGLVKQAGIVPE